ncbi:MAG TPA: invasion associated locus B family protein [Pseudolabrys sp.]|nr:invasion associated locus B family protein [Pseudolabrys sp.]
MRRGWCYCVALIATAAVGFAAVGWAADVATKPQVFKSWTLDCITPAAASAEAAPPKPYCIIHHENHPQGDPNKIALVARTRFIGKERTRAMILLLPPEAELQKGVVFSIDKNASFKARILSCNAHLCTSLFEISDVILKQLKAGNQMTIGFSLTNGQPPVQMTVPLDGYSPAFDALQKTGL